MEVPAANQVTSDERLSAALAHASVFLFGWGIFIPLVVWLVHRQKSNFVSFHALQALIFQLLQTLYWLVVMIIFVVVIFAANFLGTAIAINSPSDLNPAFMFFSQFCGFGFLIAAMGLYILVGLIASGMTLARRDFRYPLVGRWLENYLKVEPGTGRVEAAA